MSEITVSKKYRRIADTLDLTAADPRYLSDELRRRIERDLGYLPDDTPLQESVDRPYWHLPLDLRDKDTFQDAQELVHDGWGLALFHDDRPKAALRRWREALFQNVYVAPLLLDKPLPDTDAWHGIDVGGPFYAEAYLNRFGPLWDEDAQREWRRLMKRQQDIETRSLSSKTSRRLLNQMP